MFDLIIKNGRIIDGSGAEAFHGEIGVKDGKIVSVRPRIDGSAVRIIDAGGHCVAPGFVDIHRHGDAAVFRENFGETEVRQGITSIVNGQCGLSIAPCLAEHRREIFDFLDPITGAVDESISFGTFEEYTDQVRRRPLPINVGCCVGNGTVRMAVNGFAGGKMREEKIRSVREQLRASVEAGALGVTLGLVYAPENQYDADSLLHVLEAVKEFDVPLAAHIRGEGKTLHESLREVISLAERLDMRLELSHFKSTGRPFWGEYITEALNIVEEARARGIRVSIDAYPWTAGATQLYQYLPPDYQEGGCEKACARMADPVLRERLTRILREPQEYFENQLYYVGWENTVITGVVRPENRQYVGLTVSRIGEMQGKDPYDAAYDLLIDEKCKAGMINFIFDEADNERIIRKDYCCIISDSLYAQGGLPHPRVYATFPRVLISFVREKKILSIEEAIHKMTCQPARVFRLEGKGLIREGMDADIVVFDLDKLETRSTYTDPVHLPTGFDYVLVGGTVVVKDDVMDRSVHPGRVLTGR